MKVNIKNISLFLVVFNALSTIKDLPVVLVGFVLGIVALSFIITHKKLRTFLKVSVLISSFFLLKFLFKAFITTEAGVSFVLILSALKLWELDNETDYFNMFLILALLESCLFLLNPNLFAFILGLLKILIFFYFILKIRNYDLALLSGKKIFFLMVPSLFLSLILFYTFPRFTQGFISSNNSQLLFSGSDNQLNFKNLGPLNLSSSLVFKTYGLTAEKLTIPLLYWRQKIFWNFTKDVWRPGYLNLKGKESLPLAPAVTYQIKLAQDNIDFLPVLDGVTILSKSNFDYNYYNELSYKLKPAFHQSISYEAQTNINQTSQVFTPIMERKALRLDSPDSEKIKKLILGDRLFSKNLTDSEKLDLAISFFKNQKYEYTLNPPNYSSLEEFILKGKRGYCSHFAAAFAFIARTVGLPSRIISGYQGGEINPFDHSVIVREMDGHVWNEIYLKNLGWYRFDPTALVAPGRIELGASSYHDKVDPFIDLYYYQLPKSILKFAPLNRFSLWLDSINTQFISNILSFDKDQQLRLINTFLPKSFSLGWIFVFALSSSMASFWMFFNWLNKKKDHPNDLRYRKFIAQMNNLGLKKLPYESANAFRERCLLQRVDLAALSNSETDHYISYFYQKS